MKTSVSIETIGPKKAEEYLSNQVEEQRKRNDGGRHILALAKEMAENNFVLSNDAVVLVRGRLANGQNRLAAIIHTKRAQDFIVLRTDNDSIYKIMDCGKTRRISDTVIGMTNTNVVAAIARLSLNYDYEILTTYGVSDNTIREEGIITRSDIQKRISESRESIQEIASWCYSLYKQNNKLISSSITGTLAYIASRDNPNISIDVRKFIERVYDGSANMACPSRIIRERMVKNMASKGKLRSGYIFALLIKAWIAYRDKKPVGVLKMAEGEDFPKI